MIIMKVKSSSCSHPFHFGGLFYSLLVIMLLTATSWAQQADTLWFENWERTNWTNDWDVEAGTWDAGVPTSGPGKAYRGQKCAATVLGGNYPDYASTRLIKLIPFIVPPGADHPRLRFWHWFDIGSGDAGYVQIKVESGTWQTISIPYINTGGGIWSHASIDLKPFANSTVQITFLFISNCCVMSSGWYIDDIAVMTGAPTSPIINKLERWDSGSGDWFVDRGTWEVGIPSVGPDSCYSPPNCAATVLNGNYPDYAETRLICSSFKVPTKDKHPSLRFHHWYDFAPDDNGYVQIKIGRGSWQNILGPYINTSGDIWTRPFYDLSPYADSTAQIAFLLTSNCCVTAPGWYIDDVVIETTTGVSDHLAANNDIKLLALHPNHPNPFNPSTTISYQLAEGGKVELTIYNSLGQEVRKLVDARQAAGHYTIKWDGKDHRGQQAPSGVYLYRLNADGITQTRKMLLVQ